MANRVLHLVHWLTRGGIENWLLDFFRSVDRTELEMDVVCRGPSTGVLAPQFLELGANVHLVPLTWNHASFGHRLAHVLREHRYDLLHIHAGSFAGYPTQIARRSGVGAVVTFHNTRFPTEVSGLRSVLSWARAAYTRRSFRTACGLGDALISCSRSTEESVLEIARTTADGRFHVIPYGSRKQPGRDLQHRVNKRRELGLLADAPVAIHVGIFKDQKNHAALIRVAGLIRQSLPNFRLLLAGDGALRPAIEIQVRQLGLENHVMLLGSREDVEPLLEAADVMIFPSLWEGLPVAVIEAQLKGLPVIGTNIGPLREATIPGQTAILFPPECEDEMAQAAVKLLTDSDRRGQMGALATQSAVENFSIAANVRRHVEIYEQIVTRGAVGKAPASVAR